ncbi:hypothetical protein [Pectobacterium brasiliense]
MRKITESWLHEYNSKRHHESLNKLIPEKHQLMTENLEISKRV